MTNITASSHQLMQQAPDTIRHYMKAAIKEIDDVFGAGYAHQHPELVGSFVQAASIDFAASVVAKKIQELEQTISHGIGDISGSL